MMHSADRSTSTLDRVIPKHLAEAIDFARELTGQHATAAFYASFIGYKVGFKGNELSLSLLGRIAGWIAHASEQYNDQA